MPQATGWPIAGLRRLCATWLLAALAPLSWAQSNAPDDNTAAAFEWEIEAPEALAAFIRRHAELHRFLTLPDLGRSELEQLVRLASDNIRDLLGTQGYFSPTVSVSLEPAGPEDAPPALPRVMTRVSPGPLTTVASVQLSLVDPAGATATDRQALQQRINAQWGLPVGQTFTDANWRNAKARTLRGFTAQRFPLAQIDNSLADIDPQRNLAHLYLVIDTGAEHRFGPLTVEGAHRYDAAMAQRLVALAGVRPGAPYDEALLMAAQQRLTDSGYYTAAFVLLQPASEAPPESPSEVVLAPVRVQLREAPLQKVELNAGASTDNGYRFGLKHTHHRVPGIGWRAVTATQLERDQATLGSEWWSPVNDDGWRWNTGGQLQQVDDGSLVNQSQQLRFGRSEEDFALDRSLFVQFDRARLNLRTREARANAESAVSLNYAWTRRAFDDRISPNRGYGLTVELGAGMTIAQKRLPYVRGRARWQGYWPLMSETPRPSRAALRLEGGTVWSQDNAPVPATQRFWAGGDNSVRGYTPREIGATNDTGGVEPGRLLTVASLEWQRPIWREGRRTDWETALFIDVGAVADTATALDPKVGLGIGIRYKSPVGPLQADLAYGLDRKRLRLHLSVGFTF
jgi:translocation and assembly module TamA